MSNMKSFVLQASTSSIKPIAFDPFLLYKPLSIRNSGFRFCNLKLPLSQISIHGRFTQRPKQLNASCLRWWGKWIAMKKWKKADTKMEIQFSVCVMFKCECACVSMGVCVYMCERECASVWVCECACSNFSWLVCACVCVSVWVCESEKGKGVWQGAV